MLNNIGETRAGASPFNELKGYYQQIHNLSKKLGGLDPVPSLGDSGLAAVYQLKDLDSFIANTAVPPPPQTPQQTSLNAKAASSALASVANEENQV